MSDTTTKVFKYRLNTADLPAEMLVAMRLATVNRIHGRGDVPAPVVDEIRRGHNLWNRLVELHKGYEEKLKEIWASHPRVAEIEERIRVLEEQVKQLGERAAAERMTARSRTGTSAETKAALKEAKAALKEAKAALKEAKDLAYPHVTPQIGDAKASLKEGIKATYAEFCQSSEGLYWATYNDIVRRRFPVAQKHVADARKQGRSAQLRFHPWDGTGTVTVQLMRQAGQPRRSPAVLADPNGPWANVARITMQGKRGRIRLRLGAGDAKDWVELGFIAHRPIPPDADIVEVKVTRTRRGPDYEAHLCVVANVPAPPARTQGRLVAAHIGWRAMPEGHLRVAVVTGAAPPPAALVDAGIVRDHGSWQEIVLPKQWREDNDRVASLRSIRDRDFAQAHQQFCGWLDDERRRLLEELTGWDLSSVGQWRSADRLSAFVSAIRRSGKHRTERVAPGRAGIRDLWAGDSRLADGVLDLIVWDRQDLHLARMAAGTSGKLANRRKARYREVAAWVADEAAVIVVDEWSVGEAVRRPEDPGDDDRIAEAARANARIAAPGELRSTLTQAVTSRGGRVGDPPHRAAYRVHHECGGMLDTSSRMAQVMVPCQGCGQVVDQDWNVLQHMREAACS